MKKTRFQKFEGHVSVLSQPPQEPEPQETEPQRREAQICCWGKFEGMKRYENQICAVDQIGLFW